MSETKAIKYIIRKYGVSRSVAEAMLLDNVIDIKAVRNTLIREDFARLYRNPVHKVTQIYYHLAAEYDVSFPHVRFLINK